MIVLMNEETKSILKTDATKYMAILYLGTVLGRLNLPYIISVPVEIMGFASIIIILINFVKNKLRGAK